MTTETWIWIAVAVVASIAIAAVGALLILFALALGPNGPRRFAVSPIEGDLETYFDKKATWAATAKVVVPGKAERFWPVLTSGDYLRIPLLFSGPSWDGDESTYRGPFQAWTEQVARKEEEHELTTTGIGVSVPLLIKSFGQRFLLRSEAGMVTITWTVAVTPKWVGFLPLRWTGVFARPVLEFFLKRAFK